MATFLRLLPLQPFFPSTSAAAADDDDEGGLPVPGDPLRLELPAGDTEMLPADLVEELQLVSDQAGRLLLKQLVELLLPLKDGSVDVGCGLGRPPMTSTTVATEGSSSSRARGSSPPAQRSGAAWTASTTVAAGIPPDASLAHVHTGPAAAAYELCQLIRLLADLPGHRQQILLPLGVTADFVDRLWYSFLRPAHQAEMTGTGGGGGGAGSQVVDGQGGGASSWPADEDEYGLCDPGWMVPLTVCCAVFTAHIETADLDEFYKNQQPLALQQLYDESCPEAGFLSLLKEGLWQVWSVCVGGGFGATVTR